MVLAGLYGLLALVARTAPGGTAPGASFDLALFGGVAVVVGAVGVLLSLSSAPRGIEIAEDETVVFGPFGRRRTFPALRELEVRVVRRFRAGWLSSSPVEQVELVPKGAGRRVGYLLEQELLRPLPAGAP